MMLILYVLASVLALAAVSSSKSHKLMNSFSVAHAAFYFVAALYTYANYKLPLFYFSNRYFFIDHLGIYEAAISSVIFLLAAIYGGGYVEGLLAEHELKRKNLKLFYVSFNILLAVTTMSFFSNNLALFWIFAELTTVFSAILIATLNAKVNIEAALKYIFVTSTAMLFSFIGLLFLFALSQNALGTGTLNWDLLMHSAKAFSPVILTAAFSLTFMGFAAKSGIVPFHTWLPHAHAKAPSVISAILSAVLLNVGIYGIIRIYAIARQTAAVFTVPYILIGFGVLSISFASLCMIQQTNVKKLIAFSSIEQMGLILVALGIGTKVSVFWALVLILAHSLAKSLLFFSAGIMHRQYKSNETELMQNVLKLQPLSSLGLLIGIAAIMGAPPFALFIPKLFILFSAQGLSSWLLYILLLFLLIAVSAFTVFIARLVSQVAVQENEIYNVPYKVFTGMKIAIVVLIIAIIVLGIFFPQNLKNILTQVVLELGVK